MCPNDNIALNNERLYNDYLSRYICLFPVINIPYFLYCVLGSSINIGEYSKAKLMY